MLRGSIVAGLLLQCGSAFLVSPAVKAPSLRIRSVNHASSLCMSKNQEDVSLSRRSLIGIAGVAFGLLPGMEPAVADMTLTSIKRAYFRLASM
jgi:hypothetical protein